MTELGRTNPVFFSTRHPGPGSVIPESIRDRDDGPGVNVKRLKITGDIL
jgi:hypothetical protein